MRLRSVRRTDGAVTNTAELPAAPPALLVLPDQSPTLFVATSQRLYFIGLDHLELEREIGTCHGRPLALAPFPAGNRLFVVCRDSIAEVDTKLQTVLRTVGTPCPASTAALSRNGTVLFLACHGTGGLLYLDRVTLAVFDSMPHTSGIDRMAATPAGLVVAAGLADPSLLLVDPRRHVAHSVALPGPVVDMAVAAGGTVLLAVDGGEEHVLMSVGLRSGRITRQTRLPGRASSLSLWPARTPVMRWVAR